MLCQERAAIGIIKHRKRLAHGVTLLEYKLNSHGLESKSGNVLNDSLIPVKPVVYSIRVFYRDVFIPKFHQCLLIMAVHFQDTNDVLGREFNTCARPPK